MGIWKFDDVLHTSKFLIDCSRELSVPTIVTEQYPKALLHTCKELNVNGDGGVKPLPVFEKTLFSMMTDEVKEHLDGLNMQSVLICGIESHVCVQQTSLDLLSSGYDVHIIVDAVSSSRSFDRSVALRRLENAGCFLTTAESAVFQLMK